MPLALKSMFLSFARNGCAARGRNSIPQGSRHSLENVINEFRNFKQHIATLSTVSEKINQPKHSNNQTKSTFSNYNAIDNDSVTALVPHAQPKPKAGSKDVGDDGSKRPRGRYVKELKRYEESVQATNETETAREWSKIGWLKVLLPGVNIRKLRKARGFAEITKNDQKTIEFNVKALRHLIGTESAARACQKDLTAVTCSTPEQLEERVILLHHLLSVPYNRPHDRQTEHGHQPPNKKDPLGSKKERNSNRSQLVKKASQAVKASQSSEFGVAMPTIHVEWIIARCPSLLWQDTQQMKKVVNLLGRHLDQSHTDSVVAGCPQLLLHSPAEINNAIGWLGKVIPKLDTSQLLISCPELVIQPVEILDRNLQQLRIIFQCPIKTVCDLLAVEPRLLLQVPVQINLRLEWLKSALSFIREDLILSDLLIRHPRLALVDPLCTVKPNISQLRVLYPEPRDLADIVQLEPKLLTVKVSPKIPGHVVRYEMLKKALFLDKPSRGKRPSEMELSHWLRQNPSVLLDYESESSYDWISDLILGGNKLTGPDENGDLHLGNISLAEAVANRQTCEPLPLAMSKGTRG